jgi:hypothetical protein
MADKSNVVSNDKSVGRSAPPPFDARTLAEKLSRLLSEIDEGAGQQGSLSTAFADAESDVRAVDLDEKVSQKRRNDRRTARSPRSSADEEEPHDPPRHADDCLGRGREGRNNRHSGGWIRVDRKSRNSQRSSSGDARFSEEGRRRSRSDSSTEGNDNGERRKRTGRRKSLASSGRSSCDSAVEYTDRRRSSESRYRVRHPARRNRRSSNQGDTSSRHDQRQRVSGSPVRSRKKFMKPNKYAGTSSIDTFLIQFEICADYNEWSEKEKCAQLKCCLTGNAAQILWDGSEHAKLTYPRLVSKLRERFGSAGQRDRFLAELRGRRRKPGEPLSDLYSDICRLMAMAFPGANETDVGSSLAVDHFISALNDPELELRVRDKNPANLEAAYRAAVKAEIHLRSYERDKDSHGEGKIKRGKDRYDDGRVRQASWEGGRTVATISGDNSGSVSAEILLRLEKSQAEITSRLNKYEQVFDRLQRDKERSDRDRDEMSKELGRLRALTTQTKSSPTIMKTQKGIRNRAGGLVEVLLLSVIDAIVPAILQGTARKSPAPRTMVTLSPSGRRKLQAAAI